MSLPSKWCEDTKFQKLPFIYIIQLNIKIHTNSSDVIHLSMAKIIITSKNNFR